MKYSAIRHQSKSNFVALLCVASLSCCSGCQTFQPNTVAGGILGTATGGLIGASIGAHEGKAGEGALIGALVGGSAGGLLGNQADRSNASMAQQQQLQMQQARQQAVSMDQVVQMVRSGLSDELIINQIRSNGTFGPPNTNDLIVLKNNNVSDRVVAALQTSHAPGLPVAREQVIVREVVPTPDIIYAPPYCAGPPRFHQPHHFHHGRGSQVGFHVGF